MTTVLAALAAAFSIAAAYIALRHRAVGRLALRSLVRRPTETLLVILGSLLGTAIITASLIVGATLEDSFRADAYRELGPVDMTVTAAGHTAREELRSRLGDLPERYPDVEGIAFGLQSSGTIVARPGTDEEQARPRVTLLEVDFDEAAELGDDPEATGLGNAEAPGEGEIVVGGHLAERLELEEGDEVTLFAYRQELPLEVAEVLPARGLAGYPGGLTAFLPDDTLTSLAHEGREAGSPPPTSVAFVSNTGGVIEGAERTDAVTPLLRERLMRERLPGLGGVNILPAKEQVLDVAESFGDQFTEIFLSIGAFAVIAGSLLLVNIFVMLAEERKPEHGMMRAVGMRRGQLVRASWVEGFLYAVPAAAVGAVLGIGVGRVIIVVATEIFSTFAESLVLTFSAPATTVGTGFVAGLVISSFTILGTTLHTSRLNIIRAIREQPEPQARRGGLRPLLAGGVGLVAGGWWSFSAIAGAEPLGVLIGPTLVAVGAGLLVSRFVPRQALVSVLGLAVIAWELLSMPLLPGVFDDADVVVFVVLGVLLMAAGVAVVSQNQRPLGRALRRVAGPGRPTARLGLAYPLARPFRTSSTLAMFGLVVFTLVFISILYHVFGQQLERFARNESGGYALLVRSSETNPVPAPDIEGYAGVDHAATLRFADRTVEFSPEGGDDYFRWEATGFGASFLERDPPSLEERLPDYEDDLAAWRAVRDDPSLVIVEAFFLRRRGVEEDTVHAGDTVRMRDRVSGDETEHVVAATTEGWFSESGVFLSNDALTEVTGARAAENRHYVAVDGDADPEEIARSLEADQVRHGVEASTFETIVADSQQATLQFFRLMQGYLALGLLVGVAGLGVIMVRAIRERRREVGAMRALGLQPSGVRSSFLLESAFVTLQGITLGAVLSTVTAYQLIRRADVFADEEAVVFSIPWTELGALFALTFLAALAATAWPAVQAARIRPAVALRIDE